MVLTVSFVLSPVIGLSCHRHLARLLARLDAGFEASGPHDFAVRFSAIRQRRIRVHRILPRVDDVAQRPSLGQDGGSCRSDLPDGESEIFFQRGLDRANQLDRVQQFRFLAQRVLRVLAHSSHRCAPSPACGGGLGWGCRRILAVSESGERFHPPRSHERHSRSFASAFLFKYGRRRRPMLPRKRKR
jgi:hypothetical protein